MIIIEILKLDCSSSIPVGYVKIKHSLTNKTKLKCTRVKEQNVFLLLAL